MESCWLINFEDGHRMIISEELYKEEVKKIGMAVHAGLTNIGLILNSAEP